MMPKLELRFYSREEIANLIGIDMKNQNFKRKVTDTLTKFGYKYEYSRKGVNITYIPTTAEEQIKEIVLRRFGIDVQTDVRAFATFFYLLATQFEYQSCPWIERAKMLEQDEGITISDRTLRNWTNKMMEQNLIIKDESEKEAWRTCYSPTEYENYWDGNGWSIRHKKIQEPLVEEEDFKEMKQYWKDLFQYIEDAQNDPSLCEELTPQGFISHLTPNQYAAKRVWREYGCCYYYCKPFVFNAFQDEEIKYLFSLIEEYYLNK